LIVSNLKKIKKPASEINSDAGFLIPYQVEFAEKLRFGFI